MSRLTRRDFIKAAGAGTAAVLLGKAWGATSGRRPNILLVMTDDQGYGDLKLHGNPQIQTPHLDRFARESVQFERFFVSPVCSPTRASLLTGRYALRCGVWGVTHGTETMRESEITIAETLRRAGYRTGMFGKWHNGETYPNTPRGKGFEEFLGFHNGNCLNYFDAEMLRDTTPTPTKGYITDVFTDEAIEFMEAHRARPFFCYVPYNTPHWPPQVPDKYFDRCKKRGLNDEESTIYGMCENIDDNFGRLLARLDELKLSDNTIVIFLSDNGPHTVRFNSGMRGIKSSVDEGGGRVPFFIRWPKGFKGGRLIPQNAAHIDVMPTLLELCGAPPPAGVALDGKSLVPLLEGRAANWPDRMIFATRNWDEKKHPGSVRTQQYRAVSDEEGRWKLYDMTADPSQERDIATDHPALARRLSKAYDAWYADVTRAGFVRFPIPVGYNEENPVYLPAPQAYFNGGIQFRGKVGFAHDWLTSWTSTGEEVYWDIDVVTSGEYTLELGYLCPPEEAGSKIRVSIGDAAAEATVTGTKIQQLPSRDRLPGTAFVGMVWAALPLGKIKLAKGRTKLTVRAISVPGKMVMDLKHARLKRME